MAVPGIEAVVLWMGRWAWGRARIAAGKAADVVTDAVIDRLGEVVSGKLASDPALVRLEAAAADALAPEAVRVPERTAQRVALALEDAVETDQAFARALQDALAAVQAAYPQVPQASVTQTVMGNTAGGDITVIGHIGGDAHL